MSQWYQSGMMVKCADALEPHQSNLDTGDSDTKCTYLDRMTLKDLLSQMGFAPKHLSERFSHADFGGGHDSHVIYAYEPAQATHPHVASPKHHHHSSGHKSNAAMSALTLLSFLFFLHILQQCLKEHMMAMTTPPVVVMTAGREGEDPIPKTGVNKIDKAGKSDDDIDNIDTKGQNDNFEFEKDDMMRVNTAEHTPRFAHNNVRVFKNYGNRTLEYRGFVRAMDDDVK